MKPILKIMIVSSLCIFILTIAGIYFFVFPYFDNWRRQYRSFYCLLDNRCITIWKQSDGNSFIIPGKYYGKSVPESVYATTSTTNIVNVIWADDTTMIVSGIDPIEIKNQSKDKPVMKLYSDHTDYYDSLYRYIDKEQHQRYKPGVKFIGINIKENYTYNPSNQQKVERISIK